MNKKPRLCLMCGKPLGEGDVDFHDYHASGQDPPKDKTPDTPARATAPAGRRTASSLGGVCPKCGSTQFKAVRSLGRKAMWGLASLLLSADQVECVMCGTKYKRG
jgi:hypothetical protein